MVNKLLAEPGFCGENVRSLHRVYVGGDTVDAELENRFDARMREAGTDCVLSPGYGLTETGSVCVLSPEKAGGAVLGKPLVNMRCRIVDEEGKDVPAGETGELLLAGNQLMTGYLDDEAATRAAFVEEDGRALAEDGGYVPCSSRRFAVFHGQEKEAHQDLGGSTCSPPR